MMQNLSDFFSPEQEYYLENISYNRIECTNNNIEHSLVCTDNLAVNLSSDDVKITLTRALNFEPKELFSLSVSYGVILKFNKNKKNEVEWTKINLAQEFQENGDFVLANLSNRMSLLIAEITASFGRPPIILPPKMPEHKQD